MRTLDLTASLELTDGNFRCVERIGNQLTLRDLLTGDYKTLHVAELTSRLLNPPPMVTVPTRSLEALAKDELDDITVLAAHLREVETGERPGFEAPRPEYDPATCTRVQRMNAKVDELQGTPFEMGFSTLKRKLAKLNESGSAALIDGRKQKTAGTFDNIDPRVYALMCSIVDSETNKATGTIARLIRTLERQVAESHPDEEILPSDATLRRRFAELGKGRYTTAKATSRRSRDNVPKRKHHKQVRLLPGEEVQIDTTKLDIEVLGDNDQAIRPFLTIAMDVATRSIVAATIRLEGTNGTDHAFLLAQMLTGPQYRPDRSAIRAELDLSLRQQHSGLKLLDADTRKCLEEVRPFVYPRVCVTDNGRDYLSETFRAACQLFGIDVVLSAIHTPTDKAVVERQFRSINTMFTEELPGYIGNSPVNRGRRPKDAPLLDVHTLFELFDDWVINVWQNRPHPELRDRLDPSITLTPNQAFAAATELFGAMPMSLDRNTFIALLPTDWRTIGQAGIQFENRHYDSEELNPIRFTKSKVAHRDGKWEFKYHPYDPLVIWVRGENEEWIECHDRKAHFATHPLYGDLQKARRDTHRQTTAFLNAEATGTPLPVATLPDLDNDALPESVTHTVTKLTRFDATKA
jgi:transposase InsO family protein